MSNFGNNTSQNQVSNPFGTFNKSNNASSISSYQDVYKNLLEDQSLLPLQKFYQTIPKDVYKIAKNYPDFFNENLISDSRVIKQIKGSNAAIKSFYYQLMKLGFEIDLQDQKDYIEIIKSVIFDPLLGFRAQQQKSYRTGKILSEAQYKRLIAQFMQSLLNQSIPNFELTLNYYPIVDQALQKVFENLVYVQKSPNKTNQQILQYLTEIFQVTLHIYNKCYKFQESDVFVYEENKNQLYMAFMNDMEEVAEGSNTTENQQQDDVQSVTNSHRPVQSRQQHNSQIHESLQQQQLDSPQNLKNTQVNQKLVDEKQSSNSKLQISQKDNTIINMIGDISKAQTVKQNNGSLFQSNPQNAIITSFANLNVMSDKNVAISHEEPDIVIQKKESSSSEVVKYPVNIPQPKPSSPRVSTQKISNYHGIIGKTQPQKQVKVQQFIATSNFEQRVNKVYSPIDKYEIIPQSKKFDKNSGFFSTLPNLNHQNTHINNLQYSYTKSEQRSFAVSQQISYPMQNKNLVREDPRFQQDFSTVSYRSGYQSGSPQPYTIEQKNTSKEGQLIYRPKYTINYISASEAQPGGFMKKGDKQDSAGTFYRQFTNTKVLQFVNEPAKTRIKRIKNKFYGVHSKNFMGLN